MPTEIVLLSEVEPTLETIMAAGAELHPDGRYVDYRGGEIGQFISAEGEGLLQIYRSRPVSIPREAARAVVDAPTAFSLWTDMTIPFGDARQGRALAEKIAAAVDGVIKERS